MLRLFTLTALLLATSAAWAQERTAGQGNDAQINWSLLSNQLDLLKTQNQSLATALQDLQKKMADYDLCGAKGKIYAPGHPDADADKCLKPTGINQAAVVTGGGKKSMTAAQVQSQCQSLGYLGYLYYETNCTTTQHLSSSGQGATYTTSCPTRMACYK